MAYSATYNLCTNLRVVSGIHVYLVKLTSIITMTFYLDTIHGKRLYEKRRMDYTKTFSTHQSYKTVNIKRIIAELTITRTTPTDGFGGIRQ